MTSPLTAEPENSKHLDRPLLFRRRREGRRYSPPRPTVDGEFLTREQFIEILLSHGYRAGAGVNVNYQRIKIEIIERLRLSVTAYHRTCSWARDFLSEIQSAEGSRI